MVKFTRMTQHAVNFHRWIFVLVILFSSAVTNGKSLKQARRSFFEGFLFHLFFVPINLARSSFKRDELWFCDSLEQIHKCGRANEERWAPLWSGFAFFYHYLANRFSDRLIVDTIGYERVHLTNICLFLLLTSGYPTSIKVMHEPASLQKQECF